jgi:hypothetical protein
MQPPSSLPYQILSQTRPANPPRDRGYDEKVWKQLDDLYQGGYQMLENAAKYLPRQIGETPERYMERLQLVAYIGYFGGIVDYYAAALFSRQLVVTAAKDDGALADLPDPEVYAEFTRDADLKARSFSEVLKDALTTALVKQKGLIAIDFPSTEGIEIATRADEERLGVGRPYAFELAPEELIDWEYDEVIRRRIEIADGAEVDVEFGTFRFAVLRRVVCRRESPEGARGKPFEEFKIWRVEPDGLASWALYRTPPRGPDEAELDPNAEVPLVDAGRTSFREIPIVELRMPANLWIGNVIGPLNLEHYQRRSALVSSQQKSLFEMPVVKLGPEIGGVGMEMPAERAQNPARGDDPRAQFQRKGYVVIGERDDLSFVGPTGSVYTIVDTQLDKLVDEIHRVTHRMAASISSTATALARSGASKAADLEETVIVLKAYAAIAKDAALRVFDVISDAREEDVHWSAHGLDNFEAYDREGVVAEALQLDAVQVPSKTFAIEYKIRTALALLPGLSPETQATIKDEIAKATPDEMMQPRPEMPPGDDRQVRSAADDRIIASAMRSGLVQPRSSAPPSQ